LGVRPGSPGWPSGRGRWVTEWGMGVFIMVR
jgi:hypothetical protein